MNRFLHFLAITLLASVALVQGFTVSTSPTINIALSRQQQHVKSTSSPLQMTPTDLMMLDLDMDMPAVTAATTSSSSTIATTTLDPTTAFTQLLGGIINTPVILLVPILAAVSVAGVIAWFIIWYANPTDPDE